MFCAPATDRSRQVIGIATTDRRNQVGSRDDRGAPVYVEVTGAVQTGQGPVYRRQASGLHLVKPVGCVVIVESPDTPRTGLRDLRR